MRQSDPKLRIAGSRPVASGFLDPLRAWLESNAPVPDDIVRQRLVDWVPEYTPYEAKPTLRVVAGGGARSRVSE